MNCFAFGHFNIRVTVSCMNYEYDQIKYEQIIDFERLFL